MSGRLRWRHFTALLPVLALWLVFAGCGKKEDPGSDGVPKSKVTMENFDKVKTGMTEKEVLDIFGKPTETKGRELIWKSGMNVISINFKDGKVESKKPPQFAN